MFVAIYILSNHYFLHTSLGIHQSSLGLISLRDAYEPKVVIGVLYTWQANTFLRAENEMSIIDYD